MTILKLKPAAPRMHLDGMVHPDFYRVEQTLRRQLQKYPGGAAVCIYHRGECVAEYWPEFAQGGKQDITVRQVLSHQSRLYHIHQMIDRADRMLDWDRMVRAIEMTEPAHEPGTRTGYHGLTYGFLVGEIIQRVTGKKFSQLVQSEIAKPLGLDGLFIGAPKAAISRAAQLLVPDTTRRLSQTSLGYYLEKGAHGISQLMQRLGRDTDLVSIFDALAPNGISDFGFGGSGAWADPERDLAVALIVNSGMGSPFGDMRTARISGAALQCADARERHSRRWSQPLLKTG